MSEPTSSAAGGIALWKLLTGVFGIGIVAAGLGFIVLPPKTPREFASRAIATMAGSALLGPFLVAAAYHQWPWIFGAGAQLAQKAGLEPWFGLFMIGAPLLALAGLPFWWLLGAGLRWFENRKDKDLAQLAADARAEAARVVAP